MQFLSPWFLLGALAVGIPLWLHLIRREQAVRIPFSSLMFLRRIPIKSWSRQRVKYLLLLATRVLVVLLVTLAFARPYFPRLQNYVASAMGAKHVVVLLDTSMSMQYGDRWQRALAAARDVVAGLGQNDRAQIVTFSSDYQIRDLPTSDKAVLQAALGGGLSPTALPTSYAQAFRAVDSIAQESDRPLSVVLISDLQKAGLGNPPQPLSLPAIKDIRVVDVAAQDSDKGPPNWTVEGASSSRTIYRSRYPDRLRVYVRGFNTPEASRDVILSLNGKIVDKKTVAVPASGTGVVEFEGFDVPLGSNRGQVRISPSDSLPVDDVFYFTLERRAPYRILLLRETGEEAELYYLRSALAAEPDSPFVIDARTPAEEFPDELRQYGLVVLSNVNHLPPAVASALPAYVRAGGGVLILTGNRFPAPELESQLQELWPSKEIEKRVMTPDGDRMVLLGQFDPKHPVFRDFSEQGLDSLRSVETFAYIRLQQQGTILLQFANGEPALVEKQVGRGRVLLFASSFDNVWSDFPLHPAFVPLVHQLIRYTMQLPEDPAAYKIPAVVSLKSYKAAGEGGEGQSTWDVTGPDGKREVPLEEQARPDFLALREPGFYEVRQSRGAQLIAANPDPQESDLTRLPAEDRAMLARSGATAQQAAAASSPSEAEKKQTVWWTLLLIALAVALAEAYLANQYLGRGGSPVPSQKVQEEGFHVAP